MKSPQVLSGFRKPEEILKKIRSAIDDEEKAWSQHAQQVEEHLLELSQRPRTMPGAAGEKEMKTKRPLAAIDKIQLVLARVVSSMLEDFSHSRDISQLNKRGLSALEYFKENEAWLTLYVNDKRIPRVALFFHACEFTKQWSMLVKSNLGFICSMDDYLNTLVLGMFVKRIENNARPDPLH